MDLLSIVGVAAGCFLLLHVWETRLGRRQSPSGVWAVGVYAAISFARASALVVVFTYGLLLSAVVVGRIVSPMTVSELGTYIGTAQAMRDVVKGLAGVWSAFVFVSILVGLFVLVFVAGRRGIREGGAGVEDRGGPMRGVLGFVVSRGMLGTLDRGSKALFAVGLGLLCIALVAVSGDAVGRSMQDRMLLPLERLYIEVSEDEALKSFAGVVAEPEEPEPPVELLEEDEAALDSLAVAFEEAVGEALAEAHRGASGAANVTLRSIRARQGIVEVLNNARSSSVVGTGRLFEIGGLSATEREAVELYERRSGEAGPRTSLGRRFRSDLESKVTPGSRAAWHAVRQRVGDAGASFRTQASLAEFESRMFAQVLGGAVDLGGPPTSELGGVSRQFAKDVGGKVAEQMYRTASAWAQKGLAGGQEAGEVFRNVRDRQVAIARVTRGLVEQGRRATNELPRVEEIVAKLVERPPSIAPIDELKVADERLGRALDRYARAARSTGTSGNVVIPGAISQFDDLFPSNAGPSRTVRSLVAQRAGFVAATAAARSSAAQRARSYGRLRGFTKIGGVLIGRPPDGIVEALDFISVDWRSAEEGEIVLEFGRADGERLDVGPYAASLVAQALAYAADGRPIAVTMVAAEPTPDLKILLHPALLDTPLGCRIIELDRFVDTFTADSGHRAKMVDRVRAQGVFYELAWAIRLASAVDLDLIEPEDLTQEVGARVYEALSTLESSLGSREFVKADVLEQPSILVGSGGRFDEKLVEAMASCAGDSVDDWASCIGYRSVRERSAVESWLRLPPRFEVWSGVRETEYHLDADLEFQKVGDGELTPLRFMLQVAFEGDGDGESGEPWEFAGLADEIARVVEEGVVASAEDSETLAVAREFTALQRLFRNALDGRLGEDFPIERLVELAEVTVVEIGEMRTLRWTPKEFRLDAWLVGLSVALDGVSYEKEEWIDGVTEVRSCLSVLRESKSEAGAGWDEACSFAERRTRVVEACDREDEEACWLMDGIAAVDELISAVEMRMALGVTDDERMLREGRFESCRGD